MSIAETWLCPNAPQTDSSTPLAAGGIKRWGFARGNMTHGSKSKREHGSIGQATTPSRVFPGLKMPGHMGAKRTKIRKLEVRSTLGQGQGRP